MVRSAPVAYFILLRFISVRMRRRLALRMRPPVIQRKSGGVAELEPCVIDTQFSEVLAA
jgi:hypothetical protein